MPQSQKKIRHSSVQHQAQAGDTDEASLHLKSNSSSSSQSSIKASTPIPKDGKLKFRIAVHQFLQFLSIMVLTNRDFAFNNFLH